MAHDVFISYAAKDKATADKISVALEAENISCWIAPRNIQPGLSFPEAITDAVKESRLLILVFSAHANASPYVLQEVKSAFDHRLPILTFRIEEISPSKELQFFISLHQSLDAFMLLLEPHLEHLVWTVKRLFDQPGGVKETSSQLTVTFPSSLEVHPHKPARTHPFVKPHIKPLWQRIILKTCLWIALVTFILGISHALAIHFQLSPLDELYNYAGRRCLAHQKASLAIFFFSRAIEVDPNYAWAYHERAYAYSGKKLYEQAFHDYEKGLQVSTKYGDSYQLPTALQGGYLLNRAIDRYNKGNYDLAMKDLNEIIEKKYPSVLADANNPRKFFSGIAVAYYYRGAIKAANGQYDEALSDYSMAIKDGQTYPEAYKSRSNIFIAKGKYDQAISDLDQALRLNPKEPTIRGGSSTFRWANTTGPYRT
jgi:hypothetical protein